MRSVPECHRVPGVRYASFELLMKSPGKNRITRHARFVFPDARRRRSPRQKAVSGDFSSLEKGRSGEGGKEVPLIMKK